MLTYFPCQLSFLQEAYMSESLFTFFLAHIGKSMRRPLFLTGVSAGFPSPAEDYIDQRLDLNELLITHQAATYFLRVAGDSMVGAHIHSGDILVVDRALEARNGDIIIAVLHGELTVKILETSPSGVRLVPANPACSPIEIYPEMDFEIWGVVAHVIHSTRGE
jgi:DNA polymerase V